MSLQKGPEVRLDKCKSLTTKAKRVKTAIKWSILGKRVEKIFCGLNVHISDIITKCLTKSN